MPRLVYFKPKCEALVCFCLDLVTSGRACILDVLICCAWTYLTMFLSTVFQIACQWIAKTVFIHQTCLYNSKDDKRPREIFHVIIYPGID